MANLNKYITLRQVVAADIGDQIAKAVDVDDMPHNSASGIDRRSGRGEGEEGMNGLAEFMNGDAQGKRGCYWSEDIAAMKSRADRVTPEARIGDGDGLQLGA